MRLSLPDEPPVGIADSVCVRVRTPGGDHVSRRFMLTDRVEVCELCHSVYIRFGPKTEVKP